MLDNCRISNWLSVDWDWSDAGIWSNSFWSLASIAGDVASDIQYQKYLNETVFEVVEKAEGQVLLKVTGAAGSETASYEFVFIAAVEDRSHDPIKGQLEAFYKKARRKLKKKGIGFRAYENDQATDAQIFASYESINTVGLMVWVHGVKGTAQIETREGNRYGPDAFESRTKGANLQIVVFAACHQGTPGLKAKWVNAMGLTDQTFVGWTTIVSSKMLVGWMLHNVPSWVSKPTMLPSQVFGAIKYP